jgi:hypothetical protein
MAKEEIRVPNQVMNDALVAHAKPYFNLAEEPWIPVKFISGEINEVNLKELFLRSHEIADLAEPDLLILASMRRLFEGIFAYMIIKIKEERKEEPEDIDQWQERYYENSGFTKDEVEKVFLALNNHFWLYHPEYPFLQNLALATNLGEKGFPNAPISELIPYIGGASASVWAYDIQSPIFVKPLDMKGATKRVLARYFYAIPGNGGGGDKGGTFTEGPATITHIFRIDNVSLFRTFLRNMVIDTLEPINKGDNIPKGLGWLDVSPRLAGSSLYLSSISVAGTLLGLRVNKNDMIGVTTVLRRTLGHKDKAKDIKDQALGNDRHRIVDVSGSKPKAIRIEPNTHPIERLNKMLSLSSSSSNTTGIVLESNLWLKDTKDKNTKEESFELILGEKAGNASSPKWRHIEKIFIKSIYLDTNWEELLNIKEYLTLMFDYKKGVQGRFKYAFKNIEQPHLYEKANLLWLDYVDTLLDEALNTKDYTELEEASKNKAIQVYDEVTTPYMASSSLAIKISKERYNLSSKLKGVK